MCTFVTISTSSSLTDKRRVLVAAPHLSTSAEKKYVFCVLRLKTIVVAATVIYTLQRMNQSLHQKENYS